MTGKPHAISARGATRHTILGNGLAILSRELPGSPVVSFWVWYRVGGRNETPGLTGVSHWVEHMLFKGTPTLPSGAVHRLVSRHGGALNGFTSLDYTAYFETLPSARLDVAIGIEADRMVNARFDMAEVESERTVILAEKQGGENHPATHLYEAVVAVAMRAHPYRQGVIGYECDLRAITRDDLVNHYRTYYSPRNATIVVTGDFETDKLLERLRAEFGGLPPGPPLPTVRVVEPPQEGERRTIVRRPGPLPLLLIAFHAPGAADVDAAELLVLDAVLSGAGAMTLSGGGGALGAASRLQRRLVDAGLASSATSLYPRTRDPYLFTVSVALRPGVAPDDVERVALEELARLCDDLVPDEELARAKKGLRAQLAYANENAADVAYWLGSLAVLDCLEHDETFAARLAAVTADDLRRAARDYFGEHNRTVGWFLPADTEGHGG